MSALDERFSREVVTSYMRDLRYKESTIRTKLAYLPHFFRFIEKEGIADLREASAAHIEHFLAFEQEAICERAGKRYGSGTLLAVFAAVRILFASLYHAELLLTNPARGVRLRSREKSRLRPVFSEEEIAQFLDGIDVKARLGLRDRAMFELMYSSGLRSGEVGKLTRGDIDLGSRMLIVRDAKWSKDRMLPISEVAAAFMAMYLGKAGDAPRPVFEGYHGGLRAHAVEERFHHHLWRAGLEGKGLSAHSIRHATATHMLAHGADLRYVQELLGHESIETTVVYTNELLENLKRIYKQFHPRENALYREADGEYQARLQHLVDRLCDPRRPSNKRRRRQARAAVAQVDRRKEKD